MQLIREKYWEYGYEEVVTPNLFNFELWERSGHAEHYKDNMFLVDIEDQEFGLKPMNCPGACSAPDPMKGNSSVAGLCRLSGTRSIGAAQSRKGCLSRAERRHGTC